MTLPDTGYAHAARVALELRLANVRPDELATILSDGETLEWIEQASAVPTTTPAAFAGVTPSVPVATLGTEMTQTITFLTPRDVAEQLRVHPNTVYAMIGDGRLPAVQIGSQLRIPVDEFRDYLDRNRRCDARPPISGAVAA